MNKTTEKKLYLPKGFLFSATMAGIKHPDKKPDRLDMAIIYSEVDAVTAGVFTTNKVKGAPVRLCMERIKYGRGRAIVANSGNSNNATGARGLKDAREMASIAAKALGISETLVYVASTGVIGVPLPMKRIRPAVLKTARMVGRSSPIDVARAIMTTDTYPKVFSKRLKIGGKIGSILGIAKGAGMIAPKMATMLCFVLTDFALNKNALRNALKESVERSFNRITIDGDMSPSDTVIVMANGMAENQPISADSRDYSLFKKALGDVLYNLSKMIVMDGEGATKFIEVEVKGAKTEDDALKAAFSVANSCLVKTAIYGGDVNWGRVMTALGYSGAKMAENKMDIYFGKIKLLNKGVFTGREKQAEKELKNKALKITANLHMGKAKATVLTCDLTEQYVRINAHYRT